MSTSANPSASSEIRVLERTDKQGRVTSRLSMCGDKLEGVSLKYDDAGEVNRVLSYKDGRFDGMCEIYHKGNLMGQVPHVNGEKHGQAKFYDADGNLITTIEYHTGKRHGNMLSYNEMGNVTQCVPYVADKKEGVSQAYYPSGEVMKETTYKSDRKHGAMVHYSRQGTPFRVAHYRNGKLLDPAETFHPSMESLST